MANVFDNYSPLAFVAERAAASSAPEGPVMQRRSFKEQRMLGDLKKKITVGGSAQLSPNTCQLEKKETMATLACQISLLY